MIKPVATVALITAAPGGTMQLCYEVSEKKMGIEKSFSDLWIPLANNLLSPSRTIALVLSVFFVASMTGTTANIAFLIIMFIIVVQLSLASPGSIAGTTIVLETLKLPADTVGIFSAFEVFTKNAAAAYDLTYSLLEQIDAARESGKKTGSEKQ